MNGTILLVEDDLSIGEMVVSYLSGEGFQLFHAHDGEEALQMFSHQTFDLILLDLMLPKLNGMDFLRIVREKSHVPILILSAKGGEADKAIGLGFGADDYIAKPFSMIELSARVKAAIRRATHYVDKLPQQSRVINVHELSMDMDNLTVSKNGVEVKLTAKELQILQLFLNNPKKVFTKQQIFSSVWNDDYYGDENVINVHMSRLREKIEDEPSAPQYIKTLWGIGYRLGEF
ncbi:DNA-binding response regulator, OmpR family, contains REC and winged-helix (wHTH) domain [Paenibacillus uliginis N3/975]|uniref:DNA-binding response regulator, OmpR family, contains REC and winged-helix (WHTH) domain n=1 Tax=Paenibacillus uliginis N3/975 TaxID=1313296 RepID=A0A1X7HRU1_9BACL|nr:MULTISPECIES: response regulator transcription factor [Paenibacillus]SMF91351.1 DNA-binding response regulator, OmpR family, contains REC and winged-helix (wHTH) domain [Paenibacillus uliginis N3/975]